MSEGTFGNPEVVQEELDILLIGGGMACCGAAYEMMRWAEAAKAETGIDLKIKLVDKAAMDRSGAVAQGLSAINTYIGPEQDPADYARMVSNDLMGITRDDLAYDLGRHVDDSVHLFEEWGLPIWKTDADGVRHDGAESHQRRPADAEGRRQAGALRQVADHDQRRVLQVDRRRGRQEGAGHGPHPGARLHRQAGQRQERPDPHRRRGRLLGARQHDLRLQGQGRACWPPAAA